jgi:hypothetical protein
MKNAINKSGVANFFTTWCNVSNQEVYCCTNNENNIETKPALNKKAGFFNFINERLSFLLLSLTIILSTLFINPQNAQAQCQTGCWAGWALNGSPNAGHFTPNYCWQTYNPPSTGYTYVNLVPGRSYTFNASPGGGWTTPYIETYYYSTACNQWLCQTAAFSGITFTAQSSCGNYHYLIVVRNGNACSPGWPGTSSTVTYRENVSPGAYTAGTNQWFVSCFNGFSFNDYYGYYTEGNVSFNTANRWSTGGAPSSASGYVGCGIPVDNHSYEHRRRGFPCGKYQINIAAHDDYIGVWVDTDGDGSWDGLNNWRHDGCCDVHNNIWTGYLSSNSVVAIQTQEGGGGSQTAVDFINVTPSIINGNMTVNGVNNNPERRKFS